MKINLFKIISIAVLLLVAAMGCVKDKNVTHVTLDKNNITLYPEETATLQATVYPAEATNKTVGWTSSNTAVATVYNGIVTAKEVGTTTITVTTEDGNYMAICTVKVAPTMVEINGVKWATRNVDAPGTFAANPEDAGMFYQWGRPIGWSSIDPLINSNGETNWDTTQYKLVENCIWEKENDPCPPGWRVPTEAELHGLLDAIIEWEMITVNGVEGWRFGAEDNTIFLPAAKGRNYFNGEMHEYFDGSLLWTSFGYYWANTSRRYHWEMVGDFIGFTFDHFALSYSDYGEPCANAYSIRCVAE